MPPFVRAAIAVVALGLWLTPLLRMRKANRARTVQSIDRRARWGVLLEAAGYTLLWLSDFWTATPALWRLMLSIVLLAVAAIVSFQAAQALGTQLRIDASLSEGHRLIRSGPYRWVRHPVYSSFLCLLLGSGLMITKTWWLMAAGVAVFLCGTEIRVRVEDAMLADHFGTQFDEYRRAVSAYLPGVR